MIDDFARLQEMAAGMALATFIRAKALDEQLPRREGRSVASMANKQMLAQILGLLGQSRIATISTSWRIKPISEHSI